MKKITLVLCILLTLLPLGVWAEEYAEGGVVYYYSNKDFNKEAFVLKVSDPNVTSITIPDSIAIGETKYDVDSISSNAFRNCSQLTTLVFEGPSLPTMTDVDFGNVPTNLKIVFDGVQYTHQRIWDSSGYFNVTGYTETGSYTILSSINNIPVIEIADNAFSGCLSITSVTIPDGIYTIGKKAFYGCSNLSKITIYDNVSSIGALAFSDTRLFKDHADGVLYVGNYACGYKGANTSLTIKKGTVAIADSAFAYDGKTRIVSIDIPSSVSVESPKVGDKAFDGCDNNLVITYDGIKYTHQGNTWYNGDSFKVTGYTDSGYYDILGNVNTITVKSIGDNAFAGFSNKSFTIPSDIKKIGNNAFKDCVQLTDLIFSGSSLPTFGTDVFSGARPSLKITFNGIVYTHKGNTWYNGDSLIVTGHTDYTDDYVIIDAINTVKVKGIGDNAFAGISGKIVTISKNITTISSKAFTNFTNGQLHNANNLSDIVVLENQNFFSKKGALYQKEGDEVKLITCCVKSDYSDIWDDRITSIGTNAFLCHRNISSIIIPATVKTIGESAFNSAGADRNLQISFAEGSQLEVIGKAAFQESGITALDFSQVLNLREIGEQSFKGCSNLKTVKIPTSLQKIGSSAFRDCKSLSVAFPSQTLELKTISEYAFYNCKLSSLLMIPEGVVTIQRYAFNAGDDFNSNLSFSGEVRIPSSVTTISETAFPYGVKITRKLNLTFAENEEWATYYSLENLELPTGLEAWAITGFNTEDKTRLDTVKLHYIHKEEAVLLHRTGELESELWCGEPSAEALSNPQEKSSNPDIFIGSTKGISNLATIPGDKYVLIDDKFVKSNQGELKPFRCYIVKPNSSDPTSYLYFKNEAGNIDGHTYLYKEDGEFISKKYNPSMGTASLSSIGDRKMKLTIAPGKNYYAYYDDANYNDSTKSDITVRRSLSAALGRAAGLGLDNTYYHLVAGEDKSEDGCGAIEYTFDSTPDAVYEVTVNFHKRKNFSDNSATRKIYFTMPEGGYVYDGTAKELKVDSLKFNGNKVDENSYDVSYTNNVNAGSAIITVKGKREYVNSYSETFPIAQRPITEVTGKPVIPDQTYTGTEIKPVLNITDFPKGATISIITPEDYDSTYTNNTNVGTALVVVKAKNKNYKDVINATFKIVPKNMTGSSDLSVSTEYSEVKYNGDPIEPIVTVKDKSRDVVLIKNTDYDVEYVNNRYVGTATVKITFKGNYTGTGQTTFNIIEGDIEKRDHIYSFEGTNKWGTFFWQENLKVPEGLKAYVVTGHQAGTTNLNLQEVDMIPANVGVLLERTGDITEGFSAQILPLDTPLPNGITPDKNLFVGTLEENTDLSAVAGTKFILVGNQFVQIADGKLPVNRCYLNFGNEELADVRLIDLNIGTDGIITKFDGKESAVGGTASKSAVSDGKMTLTVNPNDGYYATKDDITVIRSVNAGSARAPEFDGGAVKLTAVDETADPSGVAKYTIPFISGSNYQVMVDFHKRVDFSKSGNKPVVKLKTDTYVYNGSELRPEIESVVCGGNTLDPNCYEISNYDDNINAGTGKVFIKGKRYYIGENNTTFKINQRHIDSVKVEPIDSFVYTGYPIEPKLVITDIVKIDNEHVDILNRIEGQRDYTLAFRNNINVGTAQVSIKANRINYTGTKTGITFKILPKDLSLNENLPTIEEIENCKYTGTAIKPDLKINDGEQRLVAGIDYDVEYADNIDAGIATAIIKFKGNYSGEIKKPFTIVDDGLDKYIAVNFDSENEWTTFYSTEALSLQALSDTLEAYVVTGIDGLKVTTEDAISRNGMAFIPKNTPVLLHRINGNVTSFKVKTCSGEQLPVNVKPADEFVGTISDVNVSTISGTKFVLLNGKFVQTSEGTLTANRCYFVITDVPEEITTLEIGKSVNEISILNETGILSTTIGTVVERPKGTLAITPKNGYFVELDDISVIRNTNAGSARVPQVDVGKMTVTAGDVRNNTDDYTSTYTFNYPYESGCQYQIIVKLQKSTNIQESGKQVKYEIDGTVYNGMEQKMEPTVTAYDGTNLTKDVDYVLSYPGNDYINAGKGKIVKICGIRKYANALSCTYDIQQRRVSEIAVRAKDGQSWVDGHGLKDSDPQVIFSGSRIELAITDSVKGVAGNEIDLLSDKEVTITYSGDVTNVGKVSVSIQSVQGCNYQGKKEVNYTIVAKDMTGSEDLAITAIPDQLYTGSALTPAVEVRDCNIVLKSGVDYDAEYIDNILAGTASINITFKGNYKGKAGTTFNIVEQIIERTLNLSFVDGNKWGTYIWNESLTLPEGLKAYVVTGHQTGTTTLNIQEVDMIPANVAVLVERISDKTENFKAKTMSVSTTLPEGITPDNSLFEGTLEGKDLATVAGIKFVIVNDKFVQTVGGTLAANRCYLNFGSEELAEVRQIDLNIGTDGIITMIDGKQSATGGIASKSAVSDGRMTLTVNPNNGYYVTMEDITVTRSVDAGSARAPEFDGGVVNLTAVDETADPSGVAKYTFPYIAGSNYQVLVDFHKRIDISKKENTTVIALSQTSFEYDGYEKKPEVESVTINGVKVDVNSYSVSYSNNVNSGSAKAIVAGQRIFIGNKSVEFKITQRDITKVSVAEIANQVYTASGIEPVLQVTDSLGGENVVVNEREYSLKFVNNVNVGEATISMISQKKNYKGTKVVKFNIVPKDLTENATIMPIEEQTYTGHAIEPTVTIMDGELIVPATSYDLEYANNISETTDMDMALVNVTFKGNYKGTAQAKFAIRFKEEDKQINVSFSADDEWTTYFSPIDLALPQGVKAYVVTGLKDDQPLDLETVEVTFIPKNVGVLLQRTDKTVNAFVGKTMSSYTKLEGVTPNTDLFRGTATGIADLKTIAGIKCILHNDRFIQVYDGALPANRCYVLISNDIAEGIYQIDGNDANGIVILQEGIINKNAGTATVSDVVGGVKTLTVTPATKFYVTKDEIKVVRSIKNPSQASAPHRVPGIENVPVEVTSVDAAADPSGTTKYQFEYDNDYNYQVTVNFQKRIDLLDHKSNNSVVVLMEEDIMNLEYDGKAKTPRVEKVMCNNIEVDPINYTVTYENNINAGKPRVIITGKRMLMGNTHAEFSISKRDFNNVTIHEPIPDQVYTGNPVIPTDLILTDIVDGVNIVNETDYEIICKNNVEVGTAKLTVKPINNYFGSWRDFYFNIVPASGINQIAVGDAEGEWFDINGLRLAKRPTQPGVYILRDKNNRKIKVHIK